VHKEAPRLVLLTLALPSFYAVPRKRFTLTHLRATLEGGRLRSVVNPGRLDVVPSCCSQDDEPFGAHKSVTRKRCDASP
jgi:hypothetical protein